MTDWVQDLADQLPRLATLPLRPIFFRHGSNGGRSSDFAEGKTMEAVSH